jgi:hypothetical protein
MSYIKFEKSQIVNLEYSLVREVIRTNRAGSYSSTTIVGCNTRKYHGLLICPVDEFGGERFILLSSLDVTVVNNDKSFNTGIRKYKGDYFKPKGHKYIEDFNTDTIPSRIYRVGGVILKQERLLVHNEEQYLLRLTIIEAPEPMKLKVRPFLAFRNIHQLTHANLTANTKVDFIENGIRSKLYEGFPSLNMQFSKKVEFVHVPDWYLGVEYPEEQKRGYDYSEDLFTPGFFEVKAKEGDVVIFSASTKEEKPAGLIQKFTKTVSDTIPRDSFILLRVIRGLVHGEETLLFHFPDLLWPGIGWYFTGMSWIHRLKECRMVCFPIWIMQTNPLLIQLMLHYGSSGPFRIMLKMVVLMDGRDTGKQQNQC